jgi:hypothetical protein
MPPCLRGITVRGLPYDPTRSDGCQWPWSKIEYLESIHHEKPFIMTLEQQHFNDLKTYKVQLKKAVKMTPKSKFTLLNCKFDNSWKAVLLLGKNHDALLSESQTKSEFGKRFGAPVAKGLYSAGEFESSSGLITLDVLKSLDIEDITKLRTDLEATDIFPTATGQHTMEDLVSNIKQAKKWLAIPHPVFQKRIGTIVLEADRLIDTKDVSKYGGIHEQLINENKNGASFQPVNSLIQKYKVVVLEVIRKDEEKGQVSNLSDNWEQINENMAGGNFSRALYLFNRITEALPKVKDYSELQKAKADLSIESEKIIKEAMSHPNFSSFYAAAKNKLLSYISECERQKSKDPEACKEAQMLHAVLKKMWDGDLHKKLLAVEAAHGKKKLQNPLTEKAITVIRKYIDFMESDKLNGQGFMQKSGGYLLSLKYLHGELGKLYVM